MAAPSTSDLVYYTVAPLTDSDWETNFNQVVAWFTDGDADFDIDSLTLTSDLKLVSTKKVYFEADLETYISSPSADIFDVYVGNANIIKITEAASDKVEILGADLEVDATQKIYLDAGGNSYLHEASADNVEIVSGGDIAMTFLSGNDCALEATGKMFLDAGGNSYIYEVSADVISIVAGDANNMEFRTDSTWAIQGIRFGSDSANSTINNGSTGTGTTTLYLGTYTIDTTAPSDEKTKTAISPKENVLDKLNEIEVKKFKFKKQYDTNSKQHTGMIAQEVEKIFPELVIERSDKLKAIQYKEFIPYLIKSIQEQQVIISEMDQRIKNLEEALNNVG